MEVKKILYLVLIQCFMFQVMQAQELIPLPGDSLNVYEALIQELEGKGVNIRELLDNEELSRKMKDFDLEPDSLEHYYMLQQLSEGADTTSVDKGFIAMMGKSYRDSIVLRWGPSTVDLWLRLNKTGYTLYRIEMMADDEGRMIQFDTASFRILTDTINPILPWSLERIGETIKLTDTLALIAAQAMYGSSFSSNMSTDDQDFVGRHKERKMRFGFSLLMADRSMLAAEVMGLRYVDKTVEKGKQYFYLLRPVEKSRDLNGFTIVKNDPSANQKVEDIIAQVGDSEIALFWPKDNNRFSGYWIERSADDGKSWQKLTKELLIFVENPNSRGATRPRIRLPERAEGVEGPPSTADDYYVYIDSVENYVNYTYRLSGQTPFADYTDYAYVTGTAGDLSPPPMPQVITYEVDEKSNIAYLEWRMNYEEELLEDLAGFTVWEAPHPDSTFKQISELLPPDTRNYRSPKALEKEQSHYYLLKAADDKGNVMSSFPLYMHVIDDIPPAPPRDPAYLINDTTGVVTLVWIANEEKDLAGYRVYFSNSLNSEFTQLTRAPINQNIFYDTIKLVTLSEEIYYKMQAVDISHNRSDFSETLVVKRPDYVPPVTPVMEHPDISSDRIKLIWRPSSSTDVIKHILYRRLSKTEEDWQVFQEFYDPTQKSFEDTTAQIEQLYEYSMRAIDDAGLFSDYAFPVKGRRWFAGEILSVNNMQVVYDSIAQAVQLSWEFEPPNHDILKDVDYLFYIYRSLGDSPVLRYRMLESQLVNFSDKKIKEDGQYNYAMKVVFMNGKASSLTEQLSVSVKRKKED